MDLSWIKQATDEEERASEKISITESYEKSVPLRTVRRYAEEISIRKISPYVYFFGAATRAQFCAHEFTEYRMYLGDLQNTSDIQGCSGLFYRVLTFEVEEAT